MKSLTASRMQLGRISANGFGSYPGIPRRAVREGQVEIAMEYLQRFSEAKKADSVRAEFLCAEAWRREMVGNKCEQWRVVGRGDQT